MCFKRLISMLLASLMILSLVPGAVYASGGADFYVAGSQPFFEWGWTAGDERALMSFDGAKYVASFESDGVYKDVAFKVVEDAGSGQIWHGDPTGANVIFSTSGAGSIVITYDPGSGLIEVSGTAYVPATFEYTSVYAVGNGRDTSFLNGKAWDPSSPDNKMTEVKKDVWEITYEDVPQGNEYEFKFSLDGSWTKNFGANGFEGFAFESDAAFDGGNICFDLPFDADVTLRLDLTDFDYGNGKTGAKFWVFVKPDIESVVIDDVYVTENKNGYYDTVLEFFFYDLKPEHIEVGLASGDVFEGDVDYIMSLFGYDVEWESCQDLGFPFELGENEAYLHLCGEVYCYSVMVEEAPPEPGVSSVEVDPVVLTQWYDGELREGFGFYYDVAPSRIVINFDDGTSLEGSFEELSGQIEMRMSDPQDNNEPLALGENTGTLYVKDGRYDFTIVLNESIDPFIIDIEIDRMDYTTADGVWDDGMNANRYNVQPDRITIYLAGGTIREGSFAELKDEFGLGVHSMQDSGEPLVIGENRAFIESPFAKTTFGFSIFVTEYVPPVTVRSLVIDDDGENFTVTFTGGDEDEVFTVCGVEVTGYGDEGLMNAVLKTVEGDDLDATIGFEQTETGVRKFGDDVFVTVGELTSNTLEFSRSFRKMIYVSFVRCVAGFAKTKKDIAGFAPEKYDRDEVIALAVNFAADFGKAAKYVPEEGFLMATPSMVLDAVEEVFGVTDLEIDRCAGLNPRCGNIRVEIFEPAYCLTEKCDPDGADGYSYTIYPDFDAGFESCKISFDALSTVRRIELSYPDILTGDVDGDGELTMKDVLIMRRYIAGLDELTDAQIAAGDFDGDQEITMKDVLRARRIIAGLD